MKANFLPLDIVSETDVNSLVTFFEELREAIQACGIGWLDFTKFDPPIPSRETSPDILEMFRVEFSSKPYPTPDQINIFGFLDNGRADGLYLNEEIDNILYRDRLILRKGSPSFLGKPADYMRWADACAITLSYF